LKEAGALSFCNDTINMNTFIVLLFVAVCAFGASEREYKISFTNWMRHHKKTYHHEEFMTRYQIYKNNYDYVESNNAQKNGMTLALNQFADLESYEFASLYLGAVRVVDYDMEYSEDDVREINGYLPESFNWVDQNVVTPIKNQGQCGGCWSFSTTGSTEGCHAIKTGNLVSLSEQNLIDCSGSYGNKGCNGGAPAYAMQYIISNEGIDTEASYPYTAEDGPSCQYNPANSAANLTAIVNVASGSESDLQSKASVGPVSVAIDASHKSIQLYSSGIYYEPACSSTTLDHAVLVVGWGQNGTGSDYWIVKNSWGTSWGQEGYIWMARNANNNCGIATDAVLPSC